MIYMNDNFFRGAQIYEAYMEGTPHIFVCVREEILPKP